MPFDSFKYKELPGTSDIFREFMMYSEKLKCVGEQRLGPFQWYEDDIPEEGKILHVKLIS